MLQEISVPSIIAEGTRLQGEITFNSAVTMCGVIEGELIQQSTEITQVGRHGCINGTIRAQGSVVIEGRVEGDVFASGTIRLAKTAVVKGRLVAPKVEIYPGALLDGDLSIEPEKKMRRIKRVA